MQATVDDICIMYFIHTQCELNDPSNIWALTFLYLGYFECQWSYRSNHSILYCWLFYLIL